MTGFLFERIGVDTLILFRQRGLALTRSTPTEGTAMSRTIRSHVVRTLTTGGLLAGASLIAPAIASSQSISPNRAFLSQSTLAFSVNRSLSTVAQAYSSAASGVDGERALLGRRNWSSVESE